MATPTRSQGVSTPKNPLTNTPTKPHPTASPRPQTSGSNTVRPFSYKSPAPNIAGKTPSSTHGHGHGHTRNMSLSASNATPTHAAEHMTATSPAAAAALIASMGAGTGLTPLPTGMMGDGLHGIGATGSVALVRNPSSMTTATAATGSRDPAVERAQRLREVTALLKARSAGKGITREGVERVGQIEGFTTLWDDDNLTVAGNAVDLEITFHGGDERGQKDGVKEVVLRIATGGADGEGEGQVQTEASALLKKHLSGVGEECKGPWPSLERFSADVAYLGQHDRIESSVNCFEVVGGLYQIFRRIWDAEKTKKTEKEGHEYFQICRGNVGRPSVAMTDHLGVSTEFWVDRHEFQAGSDQHEDAKKKTDGRVGGVWSANFAVEKGEPSMSSDRDWLPTKSLVTTSGGDDDSQQGRRYEKPNWQDFNSANKTEGKDDDKDAMDIDKLAASIPQPLGIHFVARLEPSILLPINVIAGINAQSPMILIEETKLVMYQQAVQADLLSNSKLQPTTTTDSRSSRSVTVFGRDGKRRVSNHSNMLYSQGGAWCYPIQQLVFAHPRQFAEIIPTLRQFALLWSILRRFMTEETGQKDKLPTNEINATPTKTTPAQPTVTKRSNKKAVQVQLDEVLRRKAKQSDDRDALNVDISIDLATSTSTVSLYIIIPIKSRKFIQITVEIGKNAIVEITSINGLPTGVTGDLLKDKAKKVLCLSEDIGVVVEWLLDEVDRIQGEKIK